ncbi:hypothetical protein, partial [Xanthomonas euvesicatoria]|uniref:hypothetical protein n=1 Tax=Xanthomonas euvesicatoria TaxID=456327 RepID=UPI001BAE5955
HRATPQPKDAAKGGQAGSEGCSSFTTVRDIGVEPSQTKPGQAFQAQPALGLHQNDQRQR